MYARGEDDDGQSHVWMEGHAGSNGLRGALIFDCADEYKGVHGELVQKK